MGSIGRSRVRVAIAAAFIATATWPSVSRSQPAQPAERIDPAWQACERDDDCASVPLRCCACGDADYVGVNRAHHDAARSRLPLDCEAVRCPAMMCQPLYQTCREGTCVVSDMPTPAQIERQSIERLVFEAQRAGYVRHELTPYLAVFAEDARIVAGRGPEVGPYDWSIDRRAIEASRGLRFSEPVDPRTNMHHESVGFSLQGDTAELEVRTAMQYEGGHEVVDEVYRLRRTDQGWRIFENRWWPASTNYGEGPVVFDGAYWAAVDAEVAAARAEEDDMALVDALQRAYRFPEAHATLQSMTEQPAAGAQLWQARGFMALLVGDTDDALLAFRRARELDSAIWVPGWAQ